MARCTTGWLIVLDMLVEQILVLAIVCFCFFGKNQGKNGGCPSSKKRHVPESLLAVPHFMSRAVFVLDKDV